MDSEHELTVLRDRVHNLESQLVAIRAVVQLDAQDAGRRLRRGAVALTALLRLPTERPGAWEATHVEALGDELRAVLDELTGGAS